MTNRTRSEESELEVVEEVLHVATALRDMGRGKHVRTSSGAGSADACARPRCAADIDSNERDDRGEAGDSMRTPRSLQKMGDGRGCETGAGSYQRTSECRALSDKQCGSGSRLKKNPRGPECSSASYAVRYICNWGAE